MRLRWNPVLRREALERWRGRRAMVVLTVYLALLSGVLYGLYRLGRTVLASQFGVFAFGGFGAAQAATAGPLLGRFLVEGLLFFLLLLVLFITPGYAAAQLSAEKERRTLPLLQVTLLRPSQIVLGKVAASSAWTGLLVLAALPLGAAAAVLGGVDVGDLLAGVVVVLVVGVSVAAMAVGISSLVRRTTAAVVLSYALVLGLTLGTGVLAILEAVANSRLGGPMGTPVALRLNPFLPLADAVDARGVSGLLGLPSPLTPFAAALPGNLDDLQAVVPIGGRAVFPNAAVTAFAVPEAVFTEVPLPAVENATAMAPPVTGPISAMTELPAGIVQPEPAITALVEPVPAATLFAPPAQLAIDPFVAAPLQPDRGGRTSVWWTSLLAYVLLGTLGALLATRRLRTVRAPRRRTTWGGFVAPPAPATRPLPPMAPSADPAPSPPAGRPGAATAPAQRSAAAVALSGPPAAAAPLAPAVGPAPGAAPPAPPPTPAPAAWPAPVSPVVAGPAEPVRPTPPLAEPVTQEPGESLPRPVREPGMQDARPDDVWDPEDDA